MRGVYIKTTVTPQICSQEVNEDVDLTNEDLTKHNSVSSELKFCILFSLPIDFNFTEELDEVRTVFKLFCSRLCIVCARVVYVYLEKPLSQIPFFFNTFWNFIFYHVYLFRW